MNLTWIDGVVFGVALAANVAMIAHHIWRRRRR